MCLVNYELASDIYNNDTRNDEIKSVEQVKREVNEIISKSTLTGETLTEQGAFMEWLLINDIKEQYLEKYKELKKVKKMEKAKQEVVQKANNILEKAIIKADKMDEMIIEEQLVGAKPLVYEIPSSKGSTYTLSVEGLNEAALRQGNIEVLGVEYKEVAGRLIAEARVKDLKRNVIQIGVAEAYQSDKFKFTTLGSKAVRNALRKVVSQVIQQKVIKEAIEAKSYIAIRVAR